MHKPTQYTNQFGPQNKKRPFSETDQKIINDGRYLAKEHWRKWQHVVDKDELESAVMLWLATHIDNLVDLYENHDYAVYFSYYKKSVFRLLDRLSQDEIVFKVTTVNSQFKEETTVHGLNNIEFSSNENYTLEEVIKKLKAKDPKFVSMAEKSCTIKQLKAIEYVYYNKMSITDTAAYFNKSVSTIYYLLERAAKNIVTKNYF
jgi:DNA-directed RNA polymerase specialized sigma24 family protein